MNVRTIWKWIPVIAACCMVGLASAKLPTPPADPAKAAEAKKKAAETAKKNAELLAKAQDRVVGHYKKQKGVAAAQK